LASTVYERRTSLCDGGQAGYLLIIHVNNPGADTLSATAFVNSVIKKRLDSSLRPNRYRYFGQFLDNLTARFQRGTA